MGTDGGTGTTKIFTVKPSMASQSPTATPSLCADGASVMGSRQSMSQGNEGKNVAHKLQPWCGHPLLVQHYAAACSGVCISSA